MVVSIEVVDDDLLLEVLNSTPVLDGVRHELLADADEHLREVRDRLQAVVRGDEPATVLTPYLDGVHLVPEVGGTGLTWRLGDDSTAARVLVAWGQVQDRMPGRLRACANDECRLFLLDRSRPGTARWCSMKTCGNRLKARRNYERRTSSTQSSMRSHHS